MAITKTLSFIVPIIIALIIWCLIAFGPLGDWLESRMYLHVLIELPMLIAIGIVLGLYLEPKLKPLLLVCNGGGIPGILLASFGLAFWMIPRWLDASLVSSEVALAKYISLVFLVGMPLAWSWTRMHFIARGLVKIELLSMLLRLGWLYLISPVRLCNNYLLQDQVWLGQGFILIALALAITWLTPVLFGSWEQEKFMAQSK